jgi:hypothetical protein
MPSLSSLQGNINTFRLTHLPAWAMTCLYAAENGLITFRFQAEILAERR